jgi:hypothetical protein
MDTESWTNVTYNKRNQTKKSNTRLNSTFPYSSHHRYPEKFENTSFTKNNNYTTKTYKQYITSDTLQTLIRRRIELKISQDLADKMCLFPLNTFKEIECNRLIPSEQQLDIINQVFLVKLIIDVSI